MEWKVIKSKVCPAAAVLAMTLRCEVATAIYFSASQDYFLITTQFALTTVSFHTIIIGIPTWKWQPICIYQFFSFTMIRPSAASRLNRFTTKVSISERLFVLIVRALARIGHSNGSKAVSTTVAGVTKITVFYQWSRRRRCHHAFIDTRIFIWIDRLVTCAAQH